MGFQLSYAGPRADLSTILDMGGERIAAAAAEAAARGVAFYTLDGAAQRSRAPRALTEGSSSLDALSGRSFDYYRTQRAAHQQVLADLAKRTGGRTTGNRRDLAALTEGLVEDASSHYSLGFDPPGDDSELHEIEVRLRGSRNKLRLRHRRYFRSRPADVEAADRTISALLLTGTTQPLANPLELSLELGASRPGEGDRLVLPLLVKVPVGRLALLAEKWAHRGQMSIFFTAGSLGTGTEPVRRAYARAGRFGLARFAATTATGLAASLSEETGDEALARAASQLLASMAEGRREVDERAEEAVDELAQILTLLPGAAPSGDGP